MGIGQNWREHFGITEAEIAQWRKQPGAGVDLLSWALRNAKIDEAQYLQWATEAYSLPVLRDHFFTTPADQELWQKLKNSYSWEAHLMPVSQWDGVLYVACIEPPKNFAFTKYPCVFVLASTTNLDHHWAQLNAHSPNKATSQASTTLESTGFSPERPTTPFDAESYSEDDDDQLHSFDSQEESSNEPPQGFSIDALNEDHSHYLQNLNFDLATLNPLEPVEEATIAASTSPGLQLSEPVAEQSMAPQPVPVASPPPPSKPAPIDRKEVPSLTVTPQRKTAEPPPPKVEETYTAAILTPPPLPPRPEQKARPHQASEADSVAIETIATPPPLPPLNKSSLGAIHVPKPPPLPNAMTPPPLPPLPSLDELERQSELQDPSLEEEGEDEDGDTVATPLEFTISSISSSTGPTDRPIASSTIFGKTLSFARNYDELGKLTIAHVLKVYDHALLFLFQNGLLKPWKWSDNLSTTSDANSTVIDLSNPSIFRIVYQTHLPYHGYVVASEVNNKFFATFFNGKLPKHVTIIPILIDNQIGGMLMGITDSEISFKSSLITMEALGSEVSSQFARLRKGKSAA